MRAGGHILGCLKGSREKAAITTNDEGILNFEQVEGTLCSNAWGEVSQVLHAFCQGPCLSEYESCAPVRSFALSIKSRGIYRSVQVGPIIMCVYTVQTESSNSWQ